MFFSDPGSKHSSQHTSRLLPWPNKPCWLQLCACVSQLPRNIRCSTTEEEESRRYEQLRPFSEGSASGSGKHDREEAGGSSSPARRRGRPVLSGSGAPTAAGRHAPAARCPRGPARCRRCPRHACAAPGTCCWGSEPGPGRRGGERCGAASGTVLPCAPFL